MPPPFTPHRDLFAGRPWWCQDSKIPRELGNLGSQCSLGHTLTLPWQASPWALSSLSHLQRTPLSHPRWATRAPAQASVIMQSPHCVISPSVHYLKTEVWRPRPRAGPHVNPSSQHTAECLRGEGGGIHETIGESPPGGTGEAPTQTFSNQGLG